MYRDKTLVLNSDMMPLGVIDYKAAISLAVTHKADVIEEYQDIKIRSVSLAVPLPAVLRLKKYVKWTQRMMRVNFNRVNVYKRDKYVCQYCGKKHSPSNLNIDHVMPKSRGGKTVWTNVTTSCVNCNSKKGNRTPEESGMSLITRPYKPHWSTVRVTFKVNRTPESWRPYLYYDREQEHY